MTTRAKAAAKRSAKAVQSPVDSEKPTTKGKAKGRKTADELDADFDINKVKEKITVDDMEVEPATSLDTVANKIFVNQEQKQPKKKASKAKTSKTSATLPEVSPSPGANDAWGVGESALLVLLAVGSDETDFRAFGGIRGMDLIFLIFFWLSFNF
jgi:hypothetical protein